jgi:hypothetical protein
MSKREVTPMILRYKHDRVSLMWEYLMSYWGKRAMEIVVATLLVLAMTLKMAVVDGDPASVVDNIVRSIHKHRE